MDTCTIFSLNIYSCHVVHVSQFFVRAEYEKEIFPDKQILLKYILVGVIESYLWLVDINICTWIRQKVKRAKKPGMNGTVIVQLNLQTFLSPI